MATVKVGGRSFIINAANDYVLPTADGDAENSGTMVQIVDTGTMSMTITVKGQSLALPQVAVVQNPQGTNPAPSDAFAAIPYRKLHLNGSVGDASYVSTAITGASIIWIPSGGIQPVLSVAYTSGSATVYFTPVRGSAAL